MSRRGVPHADRSQGKASLGDGFVRTKVWKQEGGARIGVAAVQVVGGVGPEARL